MDIPQLIDFQQIGEPSIGYISIAENLINIPFEIKRTYWVYATPEDVERGNHANRKGAQVLVCLKGECNIFLENKKGIKYHYILSNPNQGLYVPPMHWRKILMGPEVVCISLCSSVFDENDYIREYQEFLSV
jgi:hypothetical protein